MAKKYKPVKALGKPRTEIERGLVHGRLGVKYPGMKKKHAAAIKEATFRGKLEKLVSRASEYLSGKKKKKKETAASLLTGYSEHTGQPTKKR